jgi:1,4-dihydroxy-2-naphthoate octaprenyltransferase
LHLGSFSWVVFVLAAVSALLIQIGTNFANDYFDHQKGADDERRIGFQRATSSGLIQPRDMLIATFAAMGLAFIVGLGLVAIGGWVILWIGLASLLFGILYTGGPFPLGYNGLGDVFVFLFFGLAAVATTTYLHLLEWHALGWWSAVPVGALCVNILVVNNLRDLPSDAAAGKRTLGVLLGERFLKAEYVVMLILALAVPVAMWRMGLIGGGSLLSLAAAPLAFRSVREVLGFEERHILNGTLKRTAILMLVHGLLYSIGLHLSFASLGDFGQLVGLATR